MNLVIVVLIVNIRPTLIKTPDILYGSCTRCYLPVSLTTLSITFDILKKIILMITRAFHISTRFILIKRDFNQNLNDKYTFMKYRHTITVDNYITWWYKSRDTGTEVGFLKRHKMAASTLFRTVLVLLSSATFLTADDPAPIIDVCKQKSACLCEYTNGEFVDLTNLSNDNSTEPRYFIQQFV